MRLASLLLLLLAGCSAPVLVEPDVARVGALPGEGEVVIRLLVVRVEVRRSEEKAFLSVFYQDAGHSGVTQPGVNVARTLMAFGHCVVTEATTVAGMDGNTQLVQTLTPRLYVPNKGEKHGRKLHFMTGVQAVVTPAQRGDGTFSLKVAYTLSRINDGHFPLFDHLASGKPFEHPPALGLTKGRTTQVIRQRASLLILATPEKNGQQGETVAYDVLAITPSIRQLPAGQRV